MSDNQAPSRPKWRDAVKASPLTPKSRAVALAMADYWPKEPGAAMWCAVDTLTQQTGFSRASIYRAVEELMEYGYLVRVDKARQHRSPRYQPETPGRDRIVAVKDARGLRARIQRSHTEKPEVSQRRGTLDGHVTESTRGSDDLDCESRAANAAEAKRVNYSPMPITMAEKKDHRLLASFMSNYGAEAVDLVYKWMRKGERGEGIYKRPGAFAQSRWGRPTADPDVNEWQGYFIRHFLSNSDHKTTPTRAATGDPRAA